MDGHKILSGAVHRKAAYLKQGKNTSVLDKCRNIGKIKKIVPVTTQNLMTFIIVNNWIELYLYVDLVLKILSCIPSSNCSAEK